MGGNQGEDYIHFGIRNERERNWDHERTKVKLHTCVFIEVIGDIVSEVVEPTVFKVNEIGAIVVADTEKERES